MSNVLHLAPPAAARTPPSDLECEQAVLGSLLFQPRLRAALSELKPEHFFNHAHGRLYAAVVDRLEKGEPADIVTLAALAETDPQMHEAGGKAWLARLFNVGITIINAPEYGRLVYEMAQRRRLIAFCEETAAAAYGAPAAGTVNAALDRLRALGRDAAPPALDRGQIELQGMGEDIAAGIMPKAVLTGIRDLDAFSGGLFAGEQTIIGGATSMGKSALAATIALNVARALQAAAKDDPGAIVPRVRFYSGEMTERAIYARLAAQISGVSASAIHKRRLDDYQRGTVLQAIQVLKALPLDIIKMPGFTVGRIRADKDRRNRTAPTALTIVDYLGLGRPDIENRNNNRNNDLGQIANGLHDMAIEDDEPVLTLAQVNRAVASRDNKRPTLADLRDSGEIEQAADAVWFCFREEYYLEREKGGSAAEIQERETAMYRCQGRAEIIIAKHRQGEAGAVDVAFDGARTLFKNLGE